MPERERFHGSQVSMGAAPRLCADSKRAEEKPESQFSYHITNLAGLETIELNSSMTLGVEGAPEMKAPATRPFVGGGVTMGHPRLVAGPTSLGQASTSSVTPS